MRSHSLLVPVCFLVGLTAILSPCGDATARTWYVLPDGSGDAPTVQAAVDSVAAGDVILLAPGRYTWSNQGGGSPYGMVFVPRGADDFTIRGELGAARTKLDAQGQGRVIFIQGFNDIVVEGLTITGGAAPSTGYYAGGGLATHLSGDVVRDCVFEYNSAQQGGGLWCGGVSRLRIENCTFRYNTAVYGGAVFFINSTTSQTVLGCDFYNNVADTRGGALYAVNSLFSASSSVFSKNRAVSEGGGCIYLNDVSQVSVTGCTIVQNQAPAGAAVFANAAQGVSMDGCVVAFQSGGAFASAFGSGVTLSCNDVYANTSEDIPAGWVDGGGNFSADPLFCGTLGTENYFVQSTSPCLPGNHPAGESCGVVGALGSGCTGVGVEERSWGRVKALYR